MTAIFLLVLSCVMTFFYLIYLIQSVALGYGMSWMNLVMNMLTESFFLVGSIFLAKFFLKLANDETALDF